MAIFDWESFFTKLAYEFTMGFCALFCAPFYDSLKATLETIRNPQSLDGDAGKLEELLEYIEANMGSSDKVDKWIDKANKVMQRFNESGSSSSHNDDHLSSCFCGGDDACTRCDLHIKIKKKIAQGERIKNAPRGRKAVEHIDDAVIFKDGTTAKRNLRRLMDVLNHGDDPMCIGVWGPGGAGKTTLAKALNNMLESDNSFDLVRLIQLNENHEDSHVQEAVAKSLGLKTGERVDFQICNILKRKKFLLILDNVYRSIDLKSVGIRDTLKGSRIILTTRFQDVCSSIGAKPIEMGYLTKSEAWRLFAEKAGKVVYVEKIKPLAKKVCEGCGNLPLALVTVGSAMKGEEDAAKWRNAITNLQSRSGPSNVHNMESEVYNPLKFSYDALPDDHLRDCFLYCSLYPKGYHIDINELVQCWVAEKWIDDEFYYDAAYRKGLEWIRTLIRSCLLEYGDNCMRNHIKDDDIEDKGFQTVKMHDMVFDAARWIANLQEKYAVVSGYGTDKKPSVTLSTKVQTADWISFLDNEKITPPKNETQVPKATTLLFHGKNSHKVEVPAEFLNGFRKLRVLNMWEVRSFSASRLELTELRALLLKNCSGIEEVPSALQENLRILDLSYCVSLKKLPRGTEELSNLTALNLSRTNFSSVIDANAIRKLIHLEVLDMSHSRYKWRTSKSCETDAEATLQDLLALGELREVYLQLADAGATYEECRWMEGLKSFHFSYRRSATRNKREKKIHMATDRGTEVGSFILHAEVLSLRRIGCVNLIFANFSSTDLNSKLRTLIISKSTFVARSTITAGACRVISNLEELYLHRNGVSKSFFKIASALGARIPRLRSLEIDRSVEVIFSSSDLHVRLPLLDRLRIEWCSGTEVFRCGPEDIQTIAPNIRILEIHNSQSLRSICSWDSDRPWQSLKILEVKNCPELIDLPHIPSIEEIRGSQDWWDNVQWKSADIKSSMNHRFKPL